MRPMLATPATTVPRGPGWAHEVKWDGMRILAHARGGRVRLATRDERDATARFPELSDVGAGLDEVLLDGEVVALEGGAPSFSRLITRIHGTPAAAPRLAAAAPVTFMVFDVLRLGDDDLCGVPWAARRELLEAIPDLGERAQLSPVYDDGAALHRATADAGLEGVVSKLRTSRYEPGRRSADWLKLPHRPTTSVVVGGWRPETGDARRIGALLVGVPTPGGLRFVGRVGSGLATSGQEPLVEAFAGREAAASPFAGPVPAVDARGATWLRPEVVADVRSLGGLSEGEGRLRQPVFRGLRPDLSPADLTA